MTTINIELQNGKGTIAVDGGQPTPFESVEECCQMLEEAAGGEQESPAEDQGESFESGFAGARGNQAGMLGG